MLPKALALVGSGEYTHAMNETDALLLAAVRNRTPRVACIPTASGLEPGMPATWNARGRKHFEALGATVHESPITEREHCFEEKLINALLECDLFYFSGGNPNHLIECWRDTPAWAAINTRLAAGAGIAGCSAGAMMLGAHTVRVREVAAGNPPRWMPAMNVAPGIAILPHFDRMRSFVGDEPFARITASAPEGITLIGVDEDTALVRIDDAWQVSGRQTVTVFDGAAQRVIHPGAAVGL